MGLIKNFFVKSGRTASIKNFFFQATPQVNNDAVSINPARKRGLIKHFLFKGKSIKNFILYGDITIKFVDMRGKNVIITGANSGVGLMMARILSLFGANVILACRNRSKGESGSSTITSQHRELLNGNGEENFVELIESVPRSDIVDNPRVEFMHLDLRSKESIESFVKEYTEKYGELHVLINNAAISQVPALWKTDQHAELQTGVNYLAPFYLTNLLVPNLTLKNGQKSRVINITCRRYDHHLNSDNFDVDFRCQYKKYRHKQAYAQSKLYLLIFSNELNRRLNHLGIYSNAVDPGSVPFNTSINKFLPERRKKLHKMNFFAKLTGKDLFTGAATPVFAASDPVLEGTGGKYITNCSEEQYRTDTDPEIGRILWDASENEWKVKFDHTAKQ